MATSTIENGITNYVQDYIGELRKERLDPTTVIKAKQWYKKFTGTDYPDASLLDLVEMYDALQETC